MAAVGPPPRCPSLPPPGSPWASPSTASTSLSQPAWVSGSRGSGSGPHLQLVLWFPSKSPKLKQISRSNGEAKACVQLGVCVSGCVSAASMSPAVRLLSCFAPVPQSLQAMSSDPFAHHAEFCLIHFKKPTRKLNAAYKPHSSRSQLGQWLGL